MDFVLQRNTYVHYDDIGNPDEEYKDQHMVDALDIAIPSTSAPALASSFYSLESIFRQLSDISALQTSRHEKVWSLLRNLELGSMF